MKTLALFAGLAVLLSGCATAANLADDAAMTAWLGAHGDLRAASDPAHLDGAVPHNAPVSTTQSQGSAGQAPQVQSRRVPQVPVPDVAPSTTPGFLEPDSLKPGGP